MTSVHDAIRDLLLADNTVRSLVDSRIFPHHLPLGTSLPAITVHEIDGNEHPITGHGYNRYQVSCWSTKFSDVQAMKNAVKSCLNRYKGVVSGNHIKQITFMGSQDLYEPDSKIYHIPLDFQVVHYTT